MGRSTASGVGASSSLRHEDFPPIGHITNDKTESTAGQSPAMRVTTPIRLADAVEG